MSESHDDYHVHVAPVSMYLAVFGALFVLTIITWWVATFDLGAINTPLALGIAFLKASLVVMFFMHLKYNAKILWMVAVCSVLMTVVMFVFTMSDYVSRGYIPYPESWL